MIGIAFYGPLILYAILVNYIVNRVYKKREFKIKKWIVKTIFITLPLWDHFIGYVYYKFMCLSQGGVTIYKTVTDIQEQRDYWIDKDVKEYNPYINPKKKRGIGYFITLSKDFQYKIPVFYNYCIYPPNENYNYDCRDVQEVIDKWNIPTYTFKKDTEMSFEDYMDNNSNKNGYILNSSLKKMWVTDEDTKIVERGYYNYCKDEYNNLSKYDPKYQYSCKNTDDLIQKNKLKNVLRVPKRRYFGETTDEKLAENTLLNVGYRYSRFYDKDSNETLSTYKIFSFHSGWYFNLSIFDIVLPYDGALKTSCWRYSESSDDGIPNPFIKKEYIKLDK